MSLLDRGMAVSLFGTSGPALLQLSLNLRQHTCAERYYNAAPGAIGSARVAFSLTGAGILLGGTGTWFYFSQRGAFAATHDLLPHQPDG